MEKKERGEWETTERERIWGCPPCGDHNDSEKKHKKQTPKNKRKIGKTLSKWTEARQKISRNWEKVQGQKLKTKTQ